MAMPRERPSPRGAFGTPPSGLGMYFGTVFPRRCRGLAREMHLRCVGRGHPKQGGDVPNRTVRIHTDTPQRGTLLAAHGNAVGTASPYACAPTGHPSRNPRQRRGDTRPHTQSPHRGTLLATHGNAVGTRVPTRMRPTGAPFSQPTATPWGHASPHACAPTGHPSRNPRQRRGDTRPHTQAPQRGTLLATHGNAVGTRVPTRMRPHAPP